jgi:uncharacterized protein
MSQPTTIPHTRSSPEGTVFDPDATADLTPDVDALAVEDQQRALLVRVFSFVALGLITSAAVAFLALKSTDIYESALRHSLGYQLMFLLEVVSVAFIYKYVQNLSIAMVWVTFLFYSAFNGISFALFFLWLPPAAVAFGFLLTAFTFGAMALYGRNTKCDLGSIKSLGMLLGTGMGLMILLNLVFRNGEPFYATSFLGIMLFAGLTASHIQDIRNMDWEFEDDDPAQDKAALVSALLIYLDLVNLYMMIMRFAAQSRNVKADR